MLWCLFYCLFDWTTTLVLYLFELLLAVPLIVYMSFRHVLAVTLNEFVFLLGLTEYFPWYIRVVVLAVLLLFVYLQTTMFFQIISGLLENVISYILFVMAIFIFDIFSLVCHTVLAFIWLLHGNPFLLIWLIFFILSRRVMWVLAILTTNLRWRIKMFVIFLICLSNYFF